jgi:hypothetical protein
MFNPLCMLSRKLLDAFIASGQKYFVRQTFNRGGDKMHRGYLISHYTDFGQAYEHFEAIASDPHRYLYRVSEPEDIRRLQKASSQPAGYRIYASVVTPGWEKSVEKTLTVQVRKYLEGKNLWHPGKKDEVAFELYPHFGEVFVRMRFRKQEIKVSLAEVENYLLNINQY